MNLPPPLSPEIVDRFGALWKRAHEREPIEPGAAVLATADAAGRPSSRTVLCRGFDARGFVFFTNLGSRKGRQLDENPHASLTFCWKHLGCQVHAEGAVVPVAAEEADAYWAKRPRTSRIGAYASKQSQVATRGELIRRVAQFTAKFGVGKIPRPDFWSGLRLLPSRVEFWKEGEFRLHEREVFEAHGEGWSRKRLFP